MSQNDLSLVGNHFFLGLQPTTTLHDKDKYLLDALKPAGIILFKSNFDHESAYDQWMETHTALMQQVQEVVGRDKLIFAIDHEGGRVCRTPPPITRFKPAMQWAHEARATGAAMARELASLGFNISFAPVLDIHTNPDNPVIGDRAFATSPEAVADHAVSFMEGLQGEAVLACGKHFPGHGDTDVDSHYALPVLNLSMEELWERELVPFRRAIEAGLKIMMTAHILFPQIDADWPATLSHTLTTGLLRQRLGFDGVITSDDIGMQAMDRFFQKPETARRFMEAGNDMLMICAHFTDTERVIELASHLRKAAEEVQFRETVLDPSRARVDKLLIELTMHQPHMLDETVFERHAAITGVYGDATVEVMDKVG